MKKLAIVLSLFGSMQAFAGNQSAEIYKALNTSEMNVTPRGMQDLTILEKSVRGLTCKKSISFMPRPSRNGTMGNPMPNVMCSIQLEGRNDMAIYQALMVQEERPLPTPGIHTAGIKRIGNLKCTLVISGGAPNGQKERAQCELLPTPMHIR